jgi:hypothetical protein
MMKITKLTPHEFEEVPVSGIPAAETVAESFSPHHFSMTENLVAWDIRDRAYWWDLISGSKRGVKTGIAK